MLSDRPHAKILSVDATAASSIPGFAGYFGAKDLPGGNDIGAILHDEEVFATEIVTCVGQVIGIVVADTEAHAKAAANVVKVAYEDLPAVISIEDAIEANSFWECPGFTGHGLQCGDVDAVFASADHIIEVLLRRYIRI